MATKAKQQRQKSAWARFSILKADACKPHTNIRRFKDEDAHEVYLVRKNREKAALKAAVKAITA